MNLNVMLEYCKALKLGIDTKIGENNVNVTYQEYCLYIMLYSLVNQNIKTFNPDEQYKLLKGGWLDSNWDVMIASKYHGKVFDKPWDQVFVLDLRNIDVSNITIK